MNLVFLDIDGVMNSPIGKGPYYADMEEEKLKLLKNFIDQNNFDGIVLISDRRCSEVYMKQFYDVIDGFKIKLVGVIRNPREYREDPSDNRGKQIIDYLIESKENIGKMVIFDDNDDQISSLFPHEFVKINNFYGLSEEALNKAKEIISK